MYTKSNSAVHIQYTGCRNMILVVERDCQWETTHRVEHKEHTTGSQSLPCNRYDKSKQKRTELGNLRNHYKITTRSVEHESLGDHCYLKTKFDVHNF